MPHRVQTVGTAAAQRFAQLTTAMWQGVHDVGDGEYADSWYWLAQPKLTRGHSNSPPPPVAECACWLAQPKL